MISKKVLVCDIMSLSDSNVVTIKDVAERAGVAISTVSRVLNGKDRVSASTQRKVKKAINDLNYYHNPVAASLITKKTNFILVIVPDFINDFFSKIIQGIEAYLKAHNYYAMITSTGDVEDVDISSLQSKFNSIIDGIIVIPSGENFLEYQKWGKPCVIVDRYIMGSNMSAVMGDNYGGAYKLTEVLLKSNHSKIAIISGKSKLCVCTERLRGYKEALSDYGVPIYDPYICLGDMYSSSGERFLTSLVAMQDPPTAIVAGNNLICEGCLVAAKKLGLKIGVDLSLVGFDDHLFARVNDPGITVVDSPALEMGKHAAMLLLRHLDNQSTVNEEMILGVQLIERESVKML